MSVSNAVRMALRKAGKQNGDLADLWGYQVNAVSNKFQWERWTGKELSEVADLTGGRLAFVYPDGTQIMIPQDDPKKDAKTQAVLEKMKTAAKQKRTKEKKESRQPKQTKEPDKKKKPFGPEKASKVQAEQISFFDYR